VEANRIARLERSALECAEMAAKARDPRGKAVLTTAANVWRSLAKQRGYEGQSKQTGELVDRLDAAIIDRELAAVQPIRGGMANQALLLLEE
jgi:hypothetical protein